MISRTSPHNTGRWQLEVIGFSRSQGAGKNNGRPDEAANRFGKSALLSAHDRPEPERRWEQGRQDALSQNRRQGRGTGWNTSASVGNGPQSRAVNCGLPTFSRTADVRFPGVTVCAALQQTVSKIGARRWMAARVGGRKVLELCVEALM